MKSVLVEALRNGSAAAEGVLQPDTRYYITRADEPAYLSETNLTFYGFRKLLKQLEYRGDADGRTAALEHLSGIVTQLLRSDSFDWRAANDGTDAPLQLDLVLNPFELAALPFEVARGAGAYLFAQTPPVVITRRVRGAFRVHRRALPTRPRVLYAWASPEDAGPPVPHAEHFDALRQALTPWIGPLAGNPRIPDYRKVLTVLERATLPALARACVEAVAANEPYTHVHLLAHGCQVGEDEDPFLAVFGLALHDENGAMHAGSPDALAAALAPLAPHTLAVTLAACHGANQSNSLVPQGGIALTLHRQGFPVVLGSQWPLTFDGSVRLTRTFYNGLMKGVDARRALHDARLEQFGCPDCLHDWASLVGYVSLPEGYADYLDEVALAQSLAAMNTTSAWAEALVASDNADVAAFEPVVARLEDRIADLRRLLERKPPRRGDAVAAENRGLLGSGYKRLAEVLYRWDRLCGVDAARSARMDEALREAMRWYRAGFEDRLQAHWHATQFLSIEAALTGRISDPLVWQMARRAADIDARDPGEFWAFASIAELLLLAPAAGMPADPAGAAAAIDQLKARAAVHDRSGYAVQSTRRQLRRYTDWWTVADNFFAGGPDVAGPARDLLARLDA